MAEICTLCGRELRGCRLRPVIYAGKEFHYLRCTGCRSLVCNPMPDDEVLTAMYGPGYAAMTVGDYEIDSPKSTGEVIDFLTAHTSGSIIDFGCGSGDLMVAIQQETSWTPIGVEFDSRVVDDTRSRTGAEVFRYAQVVEGAIPPADALHLGDVLEHLTDLDHQMPLLLRLLRPGGYLLAEGPLQAGPAFFESILQAAQAVRSSCPVSTPPTHVLQASATGQREFFHRHGLVELGFSVYEVAWPAPSRLQRRDLRHPRPVCLYLLRRLSQALSLRRLSGNRYQYAGLVPQRVSPPRPS